MVLAVVEHPRHRHPSLQGLGQPIHEAYALGKRNQSIPPSVDHLRRHPDTRQTAQRIQLGLHGSTGVREGSGERGALLGMGAPIRGWGRQDVENGATLFPRWSFAARVIIGS